MAEPSNAVKHEPTDPGAPARKMDEATATFFAALFIACSSPFTTTNGRVVAFGAALRRPGETKTITDGKMHYSPSPAQEIVARAQQAGLVEGDILKRLRV